MSLSLSLCISLSPKSNTKHSNHILSLSLSKMDFYLSLLLLSLSISLPQSLSQLTTLMKIKNSLDPKSIHLNTWSISSEDTGAFEGVSFNEHGQVVNISLQGRGLSGEIPKEIGELKRLTGLYLHFNQLTGNVPVEIGQLTELTELYLNVNNFSGEIPNEIVNLTNLQVLQLCYNKLSGSLPTQLGSLKKLGVLALQYNNLTGAIPASFGDLTMLKRLDLSFNHLFGSIPMKLANAPMLQVLDIRNNTLSGNVPTGLKRLDDKFLFANNSDLCGAGFSTLELCPSSENSTDPRKPEPFSTQLPNKDIPESSNLQKNPTKPKKSRIGFVYVSIAVITLLTVSGIFGFAFHRRRKQKIGSTSDCSDTRLSTDQTRENYRKSSSPLISLEYSHSWDPISKGKGENVFSQEVLEKFMYNLEDVESASQHFSEVNLVGKSSFSATYKGLLRDGSIVTIKCIAKSSCKSDETHFLKGLKILTLLKHENLLKLRGFCCSKGRGECFIIYDYVSNGSLLNYLDVKANSGKVLEWSTRISIIQGIAKGITYLHGSKGNKLALVHQNLSAEKILIDKRFNPLISDAGLHKLLADDVIFSTLKASAAMGYLAPEYTTTGKFTEKSDIYAFGMIIFQVLSGKRKISTSMRQGAESSTCEEFIDPYLEGRYSEIEATKLGKIARVCTHESPEIRPKMETLLQELGEICIC